MQEWDDRVDVMITSPVFIDMELFDYWVTGATVQEVSLSLQRQGILQQFSLSADMLLADVKNHFIQFQLLDSALHRPTDFIADSSLHQIDTAIKSEMVRKYHELDECVTRELLGKKLTSRDRRQDYEELSERTQVAIRSCRRQFDNLRRVFKCVEEMPGSLVENIKSCFLVSDEMAQQYAAVVFISNIRFETSKKKLAYLTFDDFAFCANQLMIHWSYRSKESKDPTDMDVDLDLTFFQDLKDLKVLIDKKDTLDEHKKYEISLVMQTIKSMLNERLLADVDANFKVYSKALVSIAIGLNHAKEVRDLFVDIVEKLVDPFRHSDWANRQVSIFLTAHRETVKDLTIFQKQQHLVKLWNRFMVPMEKCLRKVYHT